MLLPLTLRFTAVSCPKCNVPVGEPCHSAYGWKLAVLYPHIDRVRSFGRKFSNALAVRCPTCGATPGEKCELSTGQPRPEPHCDRRLIAAD
jgi:hypothetical protein